MWLSEAPILKQDQCIQNSPFHISLTRNQGSTHKYPQIPFLSPCRKSHVPEREKKFYSMKSLHSVIWYVKNSKCLVTCPQRKSFYNLIGMHCLCEDLLHYQSTNHKSSYMWLWVNRIKVGIFNNVKLMIDWLCKKYWSKQNSSF